MGPVEDAERGREGRRTASWVSRVLWGVVHRVAGPGVRPSVEDVLRQAVGVQAETGFTQAGSLLERCGERLGAVAATPDAAVTAVPRG